MSGPIAITNGLIAIENGLIAGDDAAHTASYEPASFVQAAYGAAINGSWRANAGHDGPIHVLRAKHAATQLRGAR